MLILFALLAVAAQGQYLYHPYRSTYNYNNYFPYRSYAAAHSTAALPVYERYTAPVVERRYTVNTPAAEAHDFGYTSLNHARHENRDSAGNVVGSYSYLSPDGRLIHRRYQASAKEGFQQEEKRYKPEYHHQVVRTPFRYAVPFVGTTGTHAFRYNVPVVGTATHVRSYKTYREEQPMRAAMMAEEQRPEEMMRIQEEHQRRAEEERREEEEEHRREEEEEEEERERMERVEEHVSRVKRDTSSAYAFTTPFHSQYHAEHRVDPKTLTYRTLERGPVTRTLHYPANAATVYPYGRAYQYYPNYRYGYNYNPYMNYNYRYLY